MVREAPFFCFCGKPVAKRVDFLAGSALLSGFCQGSCHEEAHVVHSVLALEEVIEGEVVIEPLGGIDAVAVLVVVGGVIGVGHDDHVVLGGLGPQGVIADDDLPVAAPVVPRDHNGLAPAAGWIYDRGTRFHCRHPAS